MKQTFFWYRNFSKELFLIFIAIICSSMFLMIFTYIYFANDLRNKNTIMYKNDHGIVLLDRNNKPFFTFYDGKHKKFVPLSKIPDVIENAVIAAEDKDFYKHSGFSFKSIFRALWANIQSDDQLHGGSTITQQLVKNVLLNYDRNVTRKIREIILAQEIERKYSKREILEMYLNSVYFGRNAYGVEKASQYYFGKSIENIGVSEAAFLAGILPSPSLYSTKDSNHKAENNIKNIILGQMYEQGYISKKQFLSEKNAKLIFDTSERDIDKTAPHFALMVKDQLISKYGEERLKKSGYIVKTTLDLEKQRGAEKAVYDQVSRLKDGRATNGAAVILKADTSEVLAMIGSANWYDEKYGKVNLTSTPRSMGSAFKPLVYAIAFEKGLITKNTILNDSPTVFAGGYKPNNYDRRFRGRVTVTRALANSLNVPAVEVMQKVGVKDVLETAEELGIKSLKDDSNYGLSLVLGTGEVSLLEMTNVYAAFANKGIKNDPVMVLEISDKNREVIFVNKSNSKRIFKENTVNALTSILSDRKARSEVFGNALNTGTTTAVKTGTTEDWRDSLTLGYTDEVAVGVWIGNNDNSPMNGIAGSLGAAPLWKTLIEGKNAVASKIN